VSSALKPVGLSVAELAGLARTLARAGVDVIKDDHGLANQSLAPYHQRVEAVAAAVAEENARTGGHTAYFPNVTAPLDQLMGRVEAAGKAGCGGVVLCPGLTGLDAMQAVARAETGLAIMAHPSHANTSPNARRGISPDLLMGTLWRMAGADAVIYVNARGRFAWPVEACQAVNRRARGPLGSHRPAFPVPAGGIQADQVDHWFDLYGPETLLLIGGSVLEAPDVEAAARSVVEAARTAGARA
jgi:ribulose-bisphosphate carboxylase large chain